jgi:NitT/TauT family transport system permease protein
VTRRADRLLGAGLGALGIALFLLGWEVVGQRRMLSLSWPPLSTVLEMLFDPARRGLFERAIGASLAAMGTGYGIGLVAGVLAAAAAHLAPPLRPGMDRTSAVLHAIPSIALAPLFILTLGRDATPTGLAALHVFFILYVATTSGLGAAPAALRDLVAVLGGGRFVRFRRVELPAALPTIASGMRLAVPAALIGVLVGEWFGSPRGLGVLIINAMQNFQIPLLWSAVILAVVTSLTLYGLLGLVQRAAQERFR